MGLAIEKAKKNGIGWVAAKGSNHFGICQWYTEMALKQGLHFNLAFEKTYRLC
jgi:LDH2 family malate/lactate/ureidoglycolate dehydrogenase